MYCPFEYATKIKVPVMENIINLLCKDSCFRSQLGDCLIIIQRNVLKDANLYIAYHSYAYIIDVKNSRFSEENYTQKKYQFSEKKNGCYIKYNKK